MKHINNIINQYHQLKFQRTVRKILDTPPIEYQRDNSVFIVTQVHKAALYMYLAAIKSFLLYFGRGTIKALSDGSLTENDKAILYHHIPDIEIIEMSTIITTGFPTGGCWERLLYICDLAQQGYVLQIDSDTLTSKPIPEIDNAVNEQRGFCIGSPIWSELVSAKYMSSVAKGWNSKHVQALAERAFCELDYFSSGRKYLRGCAAVAGFPKAQITRENLLQFSTEIELKLGKEKWAEWGSEQVSSNVMVAQTKNPLVLPWPKYANFDFPRAYVPIEQQSLIHFIGSNRFNRGVYSMLINKLINILAQSKH